jgi:hypothetical protein
MSMTYTAGGEFVRPLGPRQAAAPILQPNHRIDPISQIDDNDGKTPDQQAPRCDPTLQRLDHPSASQAIHLQ